jgi:integrase
VLEAGELKNVLAMARSWRERAHPYDAYGFIVELLILTGQRRGQIGGLRRSYTDFGRGHSFLAIAGNEIEATAYNPAERYCPSIA